MMKQPFFILVDESARQAIVPFRDAAFTYVAACRQGGELVITASDYDKELLAWLGIAERRAEKERVEGYGAYIDPTAEGLPPDIPRRYLPSWGDNPKPSLVSLREQGFVAEAVFAALIRSSYGPESFDFFPTRSELGFYFEDSQILDTVRWDPEYLKAAQEFFMEELMPAELLAKALDVFPQETRRQLQQRSQSFEEELHGVTFLVCSDLEMMAPLAKLLESLLTPRAFPSTVLKDLLATLDGWDRTAWSQGWSALQDKERLQLAEGLCPGFCDQAEAILFTAGPRLLQWWVSEAPQ